ncbi:aspartyl-phosphate phosphatase Spo0E family protein [Niallia sp. MER TA 168]|nr:aspartyl-phosphate phosphatase Spo0E family protein [Niallia sp. MER TA 168]
MIEVGLKEGLSSTETIRISKELDRLIISTFSKKLRC